MPKNSIGQMTGYDSMDDYGPLEPEDLYESAGNPVVDGDMFPNDPQFMPSGQVFEEEAPQMAPDGGDMMSYQKMIHKMLMQRAAAKSRGSETFSKKNMKTNDSGEY